MRALRSTRPARLALDPYDTINVGRVGTWDLRAPSSIIPEASPASSNGYWMNTKGISLGRFGPAAVFNGSTSYVTVPHRDAHNNTQRITFSSWAYLTGGGSGGFGYLIDRNSSTGGWGLFSSTTNTIDGIRVNGSATFFSGGPINAWHHIVVTIEASGAGSSVKVYIDGVLIGTFSVGAITSSTGPILLGQRVDFARPLQGSLVVPSLWNRVLGLPEILRIYGDAYAGLIDPADALMSAVRGPAAAGVSVNLTGVSATGEVGSVTETDSDPLLSVTATGEVGTVGHSLSVALTGVAGAAAVGSIAPGTSAATTGVEGTGAVGSVAPSLALALTGVEGLAVVDSVIVVGDVNVDLTGVGATGEVGSVGIVLPSADAVGGDDAPARSDDIARLSRRQRRMEREAEERDARLRATLERAYRAATDGDEPATEAALAEAVEIAPPAIASQIADISVDAGFSQALEEIAEAISAIQRKKSVVFRDDDDLAAILAVF